MYSWIARNILSPIFDLSRGTNVMKCLSQFEESQWWPRERLIELQSQRFRKLITHVYANVPYYRQIFKDRSLKPGDIGCGADLIRLPVLTKQLVRENFDSLIAGNISIGHMAKNYTSGSTGEPLMFYSTKEVMRTRSYAAALRAFSWSGYETGDRCVYIGQKHEFNTNLEKIAGKAKYFFRRIMPVDVQSISKGEIPLVIKKLEGFKPDFIRGYPSAVYLLASFMEKERRKLRLRAITTFSEQVEDYHRELFRKVFSCEVYSLYSAFEAPNIAAECSSHSGYHITAENTILEIVDNSGKAVPPGEEGRILVTNLNNYAMPFIRYDIGDLGVMSDQICSCGRGLPILLKLNGRVSDFIFTKGGRRVAGLALYSIFCRFEGIVQWQIFQESYEKLTVKLVLDKVYPQIYVDQISSKIISYFKPILGDDIDITIKFVDQIPLTKAGKRKFVISKVPVNEVM